MKNFHIPVSHLTSQLAQSIIDNGNGIYIVYGVFINKETLGLNKLHKGNFSDLTINLKGGSGKDMILDVPVPEFIVAEDDKDYAKYIQIHFVEEKDIKSDDIMMQEFVKAFTNKLASTSEEKVE